MRLDDGKGFEVYPSRVGAFGGDVLLRTRPFVSRHDTAQTVYQDHGLKGDGPRDTAKGEGTTERRQSTADDDVQLAHELASVDNALHNPSSTKQTASSDPEAPREMSQVSQENTPAGFDDGDILLEAAPGSSSLTEAELNVLAVEAVEERSQKKQRTDPVDDPSSVP